MRKIILLAVTFLALVACKEDQEFNTPSFEATKDNARWSAEGQTAFNDPDGNFNIKGEIGNEVVLLTIPSRAVGTYEISSTSAAKATFTDLDGTFYSTQNNPDASVTIYPVGGKIIIDELSAETASVSGRFQFSAFTANGLEGIVFSGDANRDNDPVRYGVFYRVNATGVTTTTPVDPLACTTANVTLLAAESAFLATPSSDPNYTTVCEAYKDALLNVVNNCNGADKLNAQIELTEIPCAPSNVCNIAQSIAQTQRVAFESADLSDPNYDQLCLNYKEALQKVIDLCPSADGANAAAAMALLPCY
jgi:hypothetical protein